jgi:MarR family transcriptional regulator, transcriptional regulator for hemolysin
MDTSYEPLGRIFALLARTYVEVLSEKLSGLDLQRYYYPLILIEEHQENPLSQQQLASLLKVDKVTAQRIVNYLTQQGYIIRKKYKSDKRAYLLIVTQKARNEIPEIKNAVKDLNQMAFSGLDEEEILRFTTHLDRISGNLRSMPSVKVRIDFKRVNRTKE